METVAPIRISFGDSAYVVLEKRIIVPSAKMVMNDESNARLLQVFNFPSLHKKKGHPESGWPFGFSITRQYPLQILTTFTSWHIHCQGITKRISVNAFIAIGRNKICRIDSTDLPAPLQSTVNIRSLKSKHSLNRRRSEPGWGCC